MNRRLAIFLFVAACGGDSNNKPDAPKIMIDSPMNMATMDINGTGTFHFVTDTGVTDVPIKFSNFSILGITPNGATFDHTTGSSAADGMFTVAVGQNAPLFYVGLQFQSNPPSFIVGNNTAPDESSSNFGRQATKQAEILSMSTKTTVSATGMASWGAVDDFEVMDSNNGAMVFSPQADPSFTTKPKLGDTTIVAQQFDWLTAAPNALLPDAAQGDTTVAFQLNTATGPDNYAAIRKLATAANFTATNGNGSTMTLAMTDVTQDKQVSVAWKRSQFEALKTMVNPGAVDAGVGNVLVAVETLPDAKNRGFYGSCPDLVELVQNLPPNATDLNETFVYGNPFTSTANPVWDEWVLMRYNFNVIVQLTGVGSTVIAAGCEQDIPVASGTMTIAPDLTPVGGIKIGGMDAFTAQTGVTQTPTLSWDAPAMGTPIRYNVVLNALTKAGGKTVVTEVAAFSTSGTSVQIPDMIMLQGTSYNAEITAVTSDALPQSFCSAVTAPFTP